MVFRIKRPLSLKLIMKADSVKPVDIYHYLKDRVGSGPNVLKGLVHVGGGVWNITVASEDVKTKLLDEDCLPWLSHAPHMRLSKPGCWSEGKTLSKSQTSALAPRSKPMGQSTVWKENSILLIKL